MTMPKSRAIIEKIENVICGADAMYITKARNEMNQMQEAYRNAEMEIIEFSAVDVISTSDAIFFDPTIDPSLIPSAPPADAWD